MNLAFQNKKITGILTILPANEVKFESEMGNYNFSEAKSLKLKTTMGYNTRRVVKDGVCVSDLCIHGLQHLFDKNLLQKDEIDALVLVTQTPDYFMPPTSNIIQGHFGLKEDMICMDINQGCSGYLIGIFQSFMLLEQAAIHKVVLLNADVLSRKVSRRDRNSNPLVGDAASITILEKSDVSVTVQANIKMDGKSATALHIPAGGMKLPSSSETALMQEDGAGNFRSQDNLVMKGDEVFNFVQTAVPPMIESLLQQAGVTKEDIDYFMFHQPNKFMLQKLADKIGVSREKLPADIVENFGNGSGVSIPTAICYKLGNRLTTGHHSICMAGFGVGLTWASMVIQLANLRFCEITEY